MYLRSRQFSWDSQPAVQRVVDEMIVIPVVYNHGPGLGTCRTEVISIGSSRRSHVSDMDDVMSEALKFTHEGKWNIFGQIESGRHT